MHLLYLVLEVTGCHRLSGQLLSHRTLVPKILQTLEIKGKLYVAPQNDHNFLIFIFLDRCTYQCISFFSNLITMHDLIPLKTPNNMKSMLSCCDVSRNPCELDVDSTGEQFFSKPRGTYVFFFPLQTCPVLWFLHQSSFHSWTFSRYHCCICHALRWSSPGRQKQILILVVHKT